jgi:tetratricopeptide (TPR) repeat protein
MRKICFLIFGLVFIALTVFSQTNVQLEEAYKLYIKAINEKNIDVKIQLLEQYIAQYGKSGLEFDKYVYANLAIAYFQKRNHEKTVEYGEKSLSFQDIDNLTKINLYLIVSGAYNELKRDLEKALAYAKTAKDMANAQMESGSTTMTRDQWARLIAGATFIEGSIHVKRGELKEAIEKWTETYNVLKDTRILKQIEFIKHLQALEDLTSDERIYLEKVKAFPLEFTIPINEVEVAWGRTQSFIGRFSSMKLQIVTDYIIQTYNPPKGEISFGYYVTKTPIGNNVKITVICITGDPLGEGAASLNAHILAYYIKTGELPYPRLIAR